MSCCVSWRERVQAVGAEPDPPWFIRGSYYSAYVEEVKRLRRAGQEADAEQLLLEMIDATESESRAYQWGVIPLYYQQLAVSYRKRGDTQSEIAVLERFARQRHAGGVMPPQLLRRLATVKGVAQRG